MGVAHHCDESTGKLITWLELVLYGLIRGSNLWVFPAGGYGLWVMADLWVMVCISPPTKSVDWLSYGVLQVMGFHRYGL